MNDGYVRECHGDLHLANLVRLPTGITAFDCIEFSHDLRFIDVACDTAFLVMDLIARQQKELAFAFLNRYLEVTGDYESLKLFNLYFVYRCLVRAKVAAIRLRERAHDDPKIAEDRATIRHYCELATIQTATREPLLVLMHGLTGSGKTVAAELLSSAMPAIRIRSDIERRRLHGLSESADSGSAIGRGVYTTQANNEVYERLSMLAAIILGANHDVILDASFLDKASRDRAASVAENAGAEFAIVTMVAPLEVLRCRLLRRRAQGEDASEGRAEVLEYQLQNAQPLSAREQKFTIKWQSTSEIDVGMMVAKLRCLQVQEMLPGAPEFPDRGRTANTSSHPL
jgi:predicted kinase